MSRAVERFVYDPAVGRFITFVILFNAAVLGLETSAGIMARFGGLITALDRLCLTIFVIEILLKLAARRFGFFRDGWNVFDFAIVGIALVPAAQGLSVLRAMRVLRLLRIVSVTPRLRRVVEGFLSALPGMASVFVLMGIIFYIFAVIATKLFGQDFPEWFGTLGRSIYTLFQMMTLDSWSTGTVRPIMEVFPWAWVFFVPFVLITTFAVMNLVVGLIVNSLQDAHHAEENQATEAYRDEVLARLQAIEKRLSQRPGDEDRG
ncbi:ion transporter [Paracoccus caeni]|uniref:Ion transporter n=1 Tax=Paracoccus caeni TaxID=657651 RepID=A0A934W126_9RHOB|nr:ion transporter [Paracoccus caeni]MBK4216963.1 ion transporter [Paracoccus caeni]